MIFQISIVIYNLIREICTEFLCNKHNYMPACGGHAVQAAFGDDGQEAAKREKAAGGSFFDYFDASLAILHKAVIMSA